MFRGGSDPPIIDTDDEILRSFFRADLRGTERERYIIAGGIQRRFRSDCEFGAFNFLRQHFNTRFANGVDAREGTEEVESKTTVGAKEDGARPRRRTRTMAK